MEGKVITTTIPNPILDSGTTLVFGPQSFIQPMINEINYLCTNKRDVYKCGNAKNKYNGQTKWEYTQSDEFPTVEDFFDSFPSFQFNFDGVEIEWKAHGYLYVDQEGNNNPNLFQFAFETYPSSKVYLGGPFFKNYDILFDKNRHKVHFTPSKCVLPHVNSVLMNVHTKKIRKTLMDQIYIDDLREFQKSFNYTKDLFTNRTDNNNPYTGGDSDKEKKPQPNTPSETFKKYERFYKYIIFVLFFLISLVILCLCKRSHPQDKNLIPLQAIDHHGQAHDNSHLQDIPQDKDEQLKSEEDNQYGYKNDAVYQHHELNRDDEENLSQKSSPSQNPLSITDEEKERYKALQE